MIFLDLVLRVKVFIWSFISRGRFSLILRISSKAAKEDPEDEDGSMTGYTHRVGGAIVVLIAGGFLKR